MFAMPDQRRVGDQWRDHRRHRAGNAGNQDVTVVDVRMLMAQHRTQLRFSPCCLALLGPVTVRVQATVPVVPGLIALAAILDGAPPQLHEQLLDGHEHLLGGHVG
jgi:hypothetical protein